MPKKGITMPTLGMPSPKRKHTQQAVAHRTVADALFSRTQQRVLALLFGQPERSFGMNEMIALTGSGSGAVQREIARLVTSGLVGRTLIGRDKKYQANRDASIFGELVGIVEKTSGVTSVLKEALAPIADQVRFGILFGSVAKDRDTATSDIDVLLVSDDLTLEKAFSTLASAEHRLGRRVSPTIYTTDEFRRARRERQPFLTKVLGGKYVPLMGSEDVVASAR